MERTTLRASDADRAEAKGSRPRYT